MILCKKIYFFHHEKQNLQNHKGQDIIDGTAHPFHGAFPERVAQGTSLPLKVVKSLH